MSDDQAFSPPPDAPRLSPLVRRLMERLEDGTSAQVLISVHDKVPLPGAAFQPAIAVFRPRADNYFGGPALPSDVLLVVDVSQGPPDAERRARIPRCGQAGIPEFWLIDPAASRIEVYRGPNSAGYAEEQQLGRGESLVPLALPQLRLSIAEILGTGA